MGFTQTIKNIWSVEDLRKRIGITLLLVIIYRFGCYVVLPGINPDELMALKNFTSDGLMQLLDMFSGGAFSQASIFALGIMPYITASIVIQLLGMVLPSFQKMQREGESGRMKMNQYTRYLTVLILLLQGPAYLMNLQPCGAGLLHDCFHDHRSCRRLHVHHVARRAHRSEGRGQRHIVHHPHRYHRASA